MNCVGYQESKLTYEDIAKILEQHNGLRRKITEGETPLPVAIHLPNLEWNKELAEIAQRWADQCQFKNDLSRDIKTMTVGQNIAAKPGADVSELVATWLAELPNLTPELVSDFTKSGSDKYDQISQVIWSSTKKIGCGLSTYTMTKDSCVENSPCYLNSTVSQLVCNYGPSGNVEGESIYKTADDKADDLDITGEDIWDSSFKIKREEETGNNNNNTASIVVPGIMFMAVSNAALRILN